ncbi:helix-turn-helix domain-containing protein [Halobacteria archaeon HArc-gm2]|nr:helix-turn-helix domain-containing protein [Halobacteria archaeon HArc-gm2]
MSALVEPTRVRHLRLHLDVAGVDVHPLVSLWTGGDAVDRALGLHWNLTNDAVTVMGLVEGDREAVVAAAETTAVVAEYDVVPVDEDRFYVYFVDEGTPVAWQLFEAFTVEGLIVIPPIRYDERGITLELVGADADLQAALEEVPHGIGTTVERVGGYDGTAPDDEVTDRQRAAVEAAIEVGYYDVPRTGSQDDVAERLDCAPSTAAEHLRKAESKVLRSLFE